ncbi:MAG: NAD(P)H-hydrate dehydratase [Betaproteobacteria bacterium]|nr:NAD(P)H-hydrate dehydratase [Betaproteobacteria bacterium]
MPAHFAHATPVYLTEEMRQIELKAAALPRPPALMEKAGLAAARVARELLGDHGEPVLIVAGPGNNGGDALVVARHLRQWFFNVTVVFTGQREKLSADARSALDAWLAAGGEITTAMPPRRRWSLVVDGLFGIGLERELEGEYAGLVTAINACDAPRIAIDVPSGLHSDSGRVLGAAVRADHTVTFIGLKPGLLTLDGPDHCGELHLAPLDLDAPALLAPNGSMIGGEIVGTALRPRRINSHKGDYGSVGIIGGAHGMVGAALLAGRAALRLGAGRVYLGLLADSAPAVDAVQPELMLRRAEEVLKLGHVTCLAVGPGLGQSPEAAFVMQHAIASSLPLVLDADALNLVAADTSLGESVSRRHAPTLLTPHPAEAARLLARGTREVQHDRVATARDLAARFACLVVLKGAGSVCATPQGRFFVNTSGHPGMASAGMGDVLTGIVAALLAQGAEPLTALCTGVYLHGAGADRLAAEGVGPVGIAAGEVIDTARALLNRSMARD